MAGPKYASAKNSIAECDRCGQRYKLKELRKLTIKTKQVNIKVCHECWEPDHPQLQLGMYPVYDPQAVREPRPDTSYFQSGVNAEGSRIFQWGWNPVGGSRANDAGLTPNNLVSTVGLGSVSVALNASPTTPPYYLVNRSAVVTALNRAGVNFEPERTLFKLTLIGGRPLGDVTDTGAVDSSDALAYLRWSNGTQSNASFVLYIENVLNPYMLNNPVTYSAYLTYVP